MTRLLPFLLCLFGCVPTQMPPEPQYISGPVVPDAPVQQRVRHPDDADIRAQLDALRRSLSDLQNTVDRGP